MAKELTEEEKTERQLDNIANSHLSPEALAGTMNPPFVPDTLGSFAKHKIIRFMVQHWCKYELNQMPKLLTKIRNYASEKNIDLKNLHFDPEETSRMNNLMVIQVVLDGTTYYKHIRQAHIDRYLLELNQIADNTTV
jgi:hypothetical protein